MMPTVNIKVIQIKVIYQMIILTKTKIKQINKNLQSGFKDIKNGYE